MEGRRFARRRLDLKGVAPAHQRDDLDRYCPFDTYTLSDFDYKASCVIWTMYRVNKDNRTMEEVAFTTKDDSDTPTVFATTPCECNKDGGNSRLVVCTDVPARRYEALGLMG